MKSLKEWADTIMKARTMADAREKKVAAVKMAEVTAVKVAEALVKAGSPETIRPVIERVTQATNAWYAIGTKKFSNLKLAAADNDDIPVEKSCEVCEHPYIVKIKAWKIRSCDCAAAPCPRCSTFQIIDLDRLRKERYGAC